MRLDTTKINDDLREIVFVLLLHVHPHDLLIATDDAQLLRCHDRIARRDKRSNPGFVDDVAENRGAYVLTYNSDQRYVGSKRLDVHRHICCRPRAAFLARHVDDWDRGFLRNASDFAVKVAIEHHIADDEYLTQRRNPPRRLRAACLPARSCASAVRP